MDMAERADPDMRKTMLRMAEVWLELATEVLRQRWHTRHAITVSEIKTITLSSTADAASVPYS